MMIKLFRLLLILILCGVCLPLSAQNDTTAIKKVDYVPEVHFTVRAAYEWSTVTGQSRFMVRHARAGVSGAVLPWAGYYFQIDLCDRGKVKILDAYLKFDPLERLKIIAGQSLLPFSLSGGRAPRDYYFSNRSFPGKYYGTVRSPGVKAGYIFPGIPLYIEGGVFNSTSMADHLQWNSHFTYSAKATLPLPGGLFTHLGFQSRVPAEGNAAAAARLNMFDATVHMDHGRLSFEAEYMMVHCTAPFPTAHIWEVFAAYRIPLRARLFNRLSFEARYDGNTLLTDGAISETGEVLVSHPRGNRVTVGSTLTCIRRPIHVDFRLNYEQYFYPRGTSVAAEDNSKLVTTVSLFY